MINLNNSGLPLAWDESSKEMVFGEPLPTVKPAVRRLGDMRDVLYDESLVGSRQQDLEQELYYMYRGVSMLEEEEKFNKHGIRYDVTVLAPGRIGREHIKTAGHYHPVKPASSSTYPEVYEVVQGRAFYLIQKPLDLDDPQKGLEEVLVVEAEAGDKVLVPPGFGHVTINPDNEFLVMTNLVAAEFSSIYQPIKIMKGAGYFCLADDNPGASHQFIPNNNYDKLPPLQRGDISQFPSLAVKVKDNLPLYQAFREAPQDFAFLA